MKNKKLQVEIDEHDPTVILINGEKFRPIKETFKKIDDIHHKDKLIYKKVDEKEYDENLKILVNNIAKKVSLKELLTEMIKNLVAPTSLKQYVKEIKNKKKIKVHHGCLGIKIGKTYLQLVD
jgi:hypothetical protein